MLEPLSDKIVFPLSTAAPSVSFERIAPDGERYVPHRFKDGFFRMADPALGSVKHHAGNQLPVTFDEIFGYLQRGYLLRMRGQIKKQVNLIAPCEIKVSS